MNFHAKSQVSSSKNGRVMAVGTKEDIEEWEEEDQNVLAKLPELAKNNHKVVNNLHSAHTCNTF